VNLNVDGRAMPLSPLVHAHTAFVIQQMAQVLGEWSAPRANPNGRGDRYRPSYWTTGPNPYDPTPNRRLHCAMAINPFSHHTAGTLSVTEADQWANTAASTALIVKFKRRSGDDEGTVVDGATPSRWPPGSARRTAR